MDILLICNIPVTFHAADLRVFFSTFVETGKFCCFHYRHRPFEKLKKLINNSNISSFVNKKLCCCVIKVAEVDTRDFFDSYYRKHWIDKRDQVFSHRCYLCIIAAESKITSDNLTHYDFVHLYNLESLKELSPPSIMPQGNVGTPTKYFAELINTCRLPSVVIKKLCLNFPKSKNLHKYGMVSYDYDVNIESHSDSAIKKDEDKFASKVLRKNEVGIEERLIELDKRDSSDEEEWDRAESNLDDPSNQERNKERLYEDNIELQWEKGGPGLVWYTDEIFWRTMDGGTDEKSEDADDWDVDYSGYTNKNNIAETKDGNDLISVRREQRLRDGIDLSVSKFNEHSPVAKRKHSQKEMSTAEKIMRKYGWFIGQGLGMKETGISERIEAEGQHSKAGIGYRVHSNTQYKSNSEESTHFISTVFDKPPETDICEQFNFRKPMTSNKLRQSIVNFPAVGTSFSPKIFIPGPILKPV